MESVSNFFYHLPAHTQKGNSQALLTFICQVRHVLTFFLSKLFPSHSRARSECGTPRVLRLRAGATRSDFPLSYYTSREAICVMGGILKMIFSVCAIIHLRCHKQETILSMVPINCSVFEWRYGRGGLFTGKTELCESCRFLSQTVTSAIFF